MKFHFMKLVKMNIIPLCNFSKVKVQTFIHVMYVEKLSFKKPMKMNMKALCNIYNKADINSCDKNRVIVFSI